MFWPNGEISMGLSMPVNSHTAPPQSPQVRERQGQKQTSHSKKMVRNGAWWIEKHVPRSRLAFATMTLPNEAVEALEAREDAAAIYADINRVFQQWLSRRLEAAGAFSYIVGCDEVQPGRWKKYRKVALHTHLLFQAAVQKGNWIISKEEFQAKWLEIVNAKLNIASESNSATRIEKVKRSAEHYLAKYMSKSGNVVDEIIEAGKRYLLPAHWWHCSNALKKKVKSMCVEVSEKAGEILYGQREELKNQGILQWFYVHEIELHQSHGEPLKIPVAFCAKFSKPEHREMFIY
jgi:hypothetical protein